MNWRVPLVELDFDDRELAAVQRVLDSRWLTMGEVTQRFEQAFAEYTGAPQAVAVSNATAGLHLAVRAVGIRPGDEVILPSLSFVATASAVLYEGGVPVFCDIAGESDLCLDRRAVEQAVTSRTRAIIVMHYGGYMCDMPAILEIAGRHGLTVIEDAAHAPGASMHGRSAGTWGQLGVFSFFSNKNLAAGEGGMITTYSGELAEKVRMLRSHGMTSLTWDRHRGHAYSYDVLDLGYNYRIDEIRSALGLAQLTKLEHNNERRRMISATLRRQLTRAAEISIPFAEPRGLPAAHLFPIVLPAGLSREAFMDAMRERGVQTSIHYPPIHLFTYYRKLVPAPDLPRTESLAARQVTLPLFPTMRKDQIGLVVAAVQESLAACREAA